jgi:cytochrome c peroxidase
MKKQIILARIAEERAKLPWSVDAAAAFKGEPIPPLPLAVDLDQDKVALGNKLFHERLLSGDDTLNCESCHDLTRGGTDQAKVSTGIRNADLFQPAIFRNRYLIMLKQGK